MRYPTTVATALLLAGAACTATAGVHTTSVGADSSCDFHSLDRAMDVVAALPGRHRVRVARNITHVLTDPERVPSSVQLVGGYSSCADTTALGFTAITLRHSPPPDLVASADRVRFETSGPMRLSSAPQGTRQRERQAPSALHSPRSAK